MDVQIWIDVALQRPKVHLLPLTPEIAVLSTRLPIDFHGDPSDRLIVASSLVYSSQGQSKKEQRVKGYLVLATPPRKHNTKTAIFVAVAVSKPAATRTTAEHRLVVPGTTTHQPIRICLKREKQR